MKSFWILETWLNDRSHFFVFVDLKSWGLALCGGWYRYGYRRLAIEIEVQVGPVKIGYSR